MQLLGALLKSIATLPCTFLLVCVLRREIRRLVSGTNVCACDACIVARGTMEGGGGGGYYVPGKCLSVMLCMGLERSFAHLRLLPFVGGVFCCIIT